MDQQILQSIRDVLNENEQIAIAVGQNPALDEMAGALSLYLALMSENKKVAIASPTTPIVELSNLVGINRVKQSLDGGSGDLVVSFPYKEGEIEKVSYTLENGYLNIIVKTGVDGLSFSENEVQYKRDGGKVPVLFVIGTSRLSSLGNIFDPQILKDTIIVNIDNKSENQGFGEVVLVSPDFSSVSEMIASILTELKLEIDRDIAQNLLSGISFATQDFQSSQTSSLAFEMAGYLMKKGAVRGKRETQKTFIKLPKSSFLSQTQSSDFDDFSDLDEDFGSYTEEQFDDSFAPIPKPASDFRQKPQIGRMNPFNRQQPQAQQRQQMQSQYKPQQRGAGFQPHQQSRQQAQKQDQKKNEQTPSDWLTPKIYKGSSNV